VLVREVDGQAQLGEDILLLSRIYTGRLEMVRRPISLNDLTENVIAGHQAMAQERGVTLEYRPETGFSRKNPVSLVDQEHMMRVLNNLVGDAIRYTPEGGRVMASTGTGEEAGHVWATVAVSDMGEGILEEDLPHIFERFFREEEPRTQRVAETSLRLMIVKEIVELHGGRVTVESPSILRRGSGQAALRAGEKGVGSTFIVWLPLAG